MRGRVWKDALAKIDDIEKSIPSSRIRTNSKVHKKITKLINKYKKRKLLNRSDMNIFDNLYNDIVSLGTRKIIKPRKTQAYIDLNNLLSLLKNIAKSSQKSNKDNGGTTDNTGTTDNSGTDSGVGDNGAVDDTIGGTTNDGNIDEGMVVDPETGEIKYFSYKDINDLILDSLGYTDKEGNKSKDLFFFKEGEHARSLNEEDIIIATLSALREHLGEKNFYDLLNARTRSGKALYEEINDRYAEFNIASDQPQGSFYELIATMLNQLKESATNAGLFETAKEIFKQANTYINVHRDVTTTVDIFGTYMSWEDFENIEYTYD